MTKKRRNTMSTKKYLIPGLLAGFVIAGQTQAVAAIADNVVNPVKIMPAAFARVGATDPRIDDRIERDRLDAVNPRRAVTNQANARVIASSPQDREAIIEMAQVLNPRVNIFPVVARILATSPLGADAYYATAEDNIGRTASTSTRDESR